MRSGVCLLGVVALAACDSEDLSTPGIQAPPIRALSERDLSAWSAVSLALAQGKGPEPIAGRFATFEEMTLYVSAGPTKASLEPLCAESEISAADYAEICQALQVCLSIEVGLAMEEANLAFALPPLPGTPDLPSPPDVEFALPPEPEVPEPALPSSPEPSIPPSARDNLALFRAHQPELQRTFYLFAFSAE